MAETLSERRWAENEMVFREANEKIQQELKELKKTLERDGNSSLVDDPDMPLHFICECADENCHQRILLRPSEYKQQHQNAGQFIIVPGHTVAAIEKEVRSNDHYTVVEKFITPPQIVTKLTPTPIDNT